MVTENQKMLGKEIKEYTLSLLQDYELFVGKKFLASDNLTLRK